MQPVIPHLRMRDEVRRGRLTMRLLAYAGACFTMHKASDSLLRHVWYSPQTNSLKWAMARTGPGTVGPPGEKNKERHMSVKHMADVVPGARLFPSPDHRGVSEHCRPLPACWCFIFMCNIQDLVVSQSGGESHGLSGACAIRCGILMRHLLHIQVGSDSRRWWQV